ncbi:MAG: hypothetical protein QMB63_07875 [Clostridiaceae bacterium]
MFDKEELEILLIKKHVKKEDLAQYLGINLVTLYRKINGETEWKRNEMIKTAEFLGESDLSFIFFKK